MGRPIWEVTWPVLAATAIVALFIYFMIPPTPRENAVEESLTLAEAYKLYGDSFSCMHVSGEVCADFISKVAGNRELIDVLQKAASRGVTVYVRDEFQVGYGWVDVDKNASPEVIVRFLGMGIRQSELRNSQRSR